MTAQSQITEKSCIISPLEELSGAFVSKVNNLLELEEVIQKYAKIISLYYPEMEVNTILESLRSGFNLRLFRDFFPIYILDIGTLSARSLDQVNFSEIAKTYGGSVIIFCNTNNSCLLGPEFNEMFTFRVDNFMGYGFHYYNRKIFIDTQERENQIANIFTKNLGTFGEQIERPDIKVNVITSRNLNQLLGEKNFILRGLASEFAYNWGQYPYNEGLLNPNESGSFDPPHKDKIAYYIPEVERDKLVEMNLEKARKRGNKEVTLEEFNAKKALGWIDFWSEARTFEYLRRGSLNKDFTLVALADNENRIVAWYVSYISNPLEVMKCRALDQVTQEEVSEALYIDTVGFGRTYRIGDNKKVKRDLELRIMDIQNQLVLAYGGHAFTRVHKGDSKVALKALELLGFHGTNIDAAIDSDRRFMIRGMSLGSVEQGEISQVEIMHTMNYLTLVVAPILEKLNIATRKIESFLLESIDMYIKANPNILEGEIVDFAKIKLDIEDGTLRRKIIKGYSSAEGALDLIISWPVSLSLAVITHLYVLSKNPAASSALIGFESIPVLGGLSSLYRTIYLLGRIGVPQTLENLRDNRGNNEYEPLLRSLGSFFDGGALIVPLLKDEENSTIAKIFLWRMSVEVKNLPAKVKYLPMKLRNHFSRLADRLYKVEEENES